MVALEAQPTWDSSLADLAPRGTVSGGGAAFWTIGCNLLIPLAIAAVLLAKGKRSGREARAADELERGADALPAPGTELVRGVVEAAAGPAVVVTSEQTGRESSYKGNWSTMWTETQRTVDARPFVLVTASGSRLRCEPDSRTKLIDDLDVTERLSLTTRLRRALLSDGENAIVRGRIDERIVAGGAGGYREPGRELVLRPGPDGMMISTKGLAAPLRAAAARWTKFARWFLFFAAISGYVTFPWVVSAVAGHVETGVLVAFGSRSVRTKTGTTQVSTIRYTVGQERTEYEDDIESFVASRRYSPGTRLPVRVSPGAVHVGTRASVGIVGALLNTIFVAMATLMATGLMAGGGAWYEQKKLLEGRSGKLREDWVEPAPSRRSAPLRGGGREARKRR